jgi:ParB-like chromosome segregation protein Spo0J
MKIETVDINTIKPYWRNPRKNNGAIEAIKNSIAKYGYNNPILIDKDNVIISGHTRCMALRQLQKKDIPILRLDLSEQKAKEFRIVDNKSSELALWDDEKLMQELREISDIDDMQKYFNDLDLNKMISENLEVKPIEVSDENLGKTLEEQEDNFVNTQEENLHRVMCPHCLKEHYVNREELNNFKPDWQTKLAEE